MHGFEETGSTEHVRSLKIQTFTRVKYKNDSSSNRAEFCGLDYWDNMQTNGGLF
jgi:hypothetical protein